MERNLGEQFLYLKKLMRTEDRMELPTDDSYYERMLGDIMVAVEKTEMAPPPPVYHTQPYWHKPWREWLYSSKGMSSVIAICFLISSFR